MKIVTEKQEKISILKLSGELDASNAIDVDTIMLHLIREKPDQIWIDGEEINYISSAGLGVFLSHLQTLTDQKINLLFYNLNSKIRNVFTILGLDSLVQIVADRNAAEALCPAEMETALSKVS
jgi:anti-sigma B factor antagonist